jgi:hypothetical protein
VLLKTLLLSQCRIGSFCLALDYEFFNRIGQGQTLQAQVISIPFLRSLEAMLLMRYYSIGSPQVGGRGPRSTRRFCTDRNDTWVCRYLLAEAYGRLGLCRCAERDFLTLAIFRICVFEVE